MDDIKTTDLARMKEFRDLTNRRFRCVASRIKNQDGRVDICMRIASTINDSIVDGPGFRYTVFVQGCPHHCHGCHNPDTWAFDGGREATPEELIEPLKRNPLASGLTISGGEPFAQTDECAELARLAHELGLTVWTYTGYRYEELLPRHLVSR